VEFLLFLVFGFALMWLLIVLPQRRRQQAQTSMIDALKPGDYVVTAGGLYGTVTEVDEEDLGLEVAPEVEVRVAKKAIGAVIPPDQIEDVEIGEPAEAPEARTAPQPPTAEDRR
jgi:preprotein translocase subunit YajC